MSVRTFFEALRARRPTVPPQREGDGAAAPPARAPGSSGGFRLCDTVILPTESIPVVALRRLVDYWDALRDDVDVLPSLRDVDPDRAQVLPGRVHLVRVEGPGRFRFLHYGAAVTNPDARDMVGLTTADYEDDVFAALVTEHYAEAVTARHPVCRAIRAVQNGGSYDYVRVVAPFGLDGEDVAFLLVATHRLALPDGLDRATPPADPETLREAVERTRRLALQVSGSEAGVALAGLAAAAALHFAEATHLAARKAD